MITQKMREIERFARLAPCERMQQCYVIGLRATQGQYPHVQVVLHFTSD